MLTIPMEPHRLGELIDHLGRLQAYYIAEAAALSRTAGPFAASLAGRRLELARSAEELWTYLLEI